MTDKITLSIIIVNFNTELFLADCLKSINNCDFSKNEMEILIVDNNSKINPEKVINTHFPGAKIIFNKKNEGFAKANNKAIRQAKGKYILLLNPDTILTRKVLRVLLEFMDRNNTAGIVTPRVELADGQIDDSCHRGFPTPWNALCHFTGLGTLFPSSIVFNGYHLGYGNMEKIHEIDSCSGAFMFIRKEAGVAAGWLDEDYFWYGEDIDFCYNVKDRKWKVYYLPLEKIIHLKGVASGIKRHTEAISSASEETRSLATKARFEVMRIFYEKHYKNKYPGILQYLIFSGIKFKETLTLFLQKFSLI